MWKKEIKKRSKIKTGKFDAQGINTDDVVFSRSIKQFPMSFWFLKCDLRGFWH